jgi:hypothetical protein
MTPCCERCRWWSNVRARVRGDAVHDEIGDDVAMDEFDAPRTQRRCLIIIHGNRGPNAGDDVAAFVADGSGYAAALYTRPDFCCSLFEIGG